MKFAEWTNANAPIFFGLMAVTLIIALIYGAKNGGWNRNLPFMFTLLIFVLYYLLSPYYFYITGRKRIIGTDISGYYGMAAFFGFLGVLFFFFGYLSRPLMVQFKAQRSIGLPNIQRILSILFYGIYGLVLTNMAAGGINVVNIFIGNEVVGLGAEGASYYLQNFADSLITVVLLGYLVGIPTRRLLIWIALSFFLFTLLGFRYRILLTFFGLLIVFVMRNKIMFKQMLIGIFLAGFFLYGVVFMTANRKELILRQYNQLEFNPFVVKGDLIFEQTRGTLADMTIYKVYENPFKEVKHDYGASMFAYIFVRMIPRFVYPQKDEFYPTPQTKVQWAALDAWWAKYAGESLLSNGCFYIAFGWVGIVLGSFFWGLGLKAFTNSVDYANIFSVTTYIVITLVTFQWVTRAYFPQTVDHAVYMLFPVWVLRWLQRRYIKKTSFTQQKQLQKQVLGYE